MYAVVLHEYGSVDQLKYEDVPTPKPGPKEILVRVEAASINPVDWKLRSGHAKRMMPLEFPAILGRDVAGTVEAVGEGTTRFKVGDRVMGLVQHGYAELTTGGEEGFAPIPGGMSFETAAALPLVVLTGEQLIHEAAKVKPGQTVLVTGAVGSVGRVAVHAAMRAGARVIAGVRANQKDAAHALGVADVVDVDSPDELKALSRIDVVADTVGGDIASQLVPLMRDRGVFASVLGEPPNAKERADVRFASMMAHPDPETLARVANDVAEGQFEVPVGRRFPLHQAAEAQAIAEHGHVGKVILFPANPS